jgi:hypothetical protein
MKFGHTTAHALALTKQDTTAPSGFASDRALRWCHSKAVWFLSRDATRLNCSGRQRKRDHHSSCFGTAEMGCCAQSWPLPLRRKLMLHAGLPDTLTLKERFHFNCTNKMPRTNLSVVIVWALRHGEPEVYFHALSSCQIHVPSALSSWKDPPGAVSTGVKRPEILPWSSGP